MIDWPVNATTSTLDHPRGWKWVPITDVAQLVTGHTPARSNPSYWNGGVSWINLNEIRQLNGTTCNETQLQISAAGVAKSSAVVHPAGTICMSRTASVGFVTKMGRPMSTSQDFVNWIPGPEIESDYLMKALVASRPQILELCSGSTHKTMYVRDAERLRVLLPPIEEQRRIAAVLDAADALRAKRRQALAKLDTLTQAIFIYMFGDSRMWPDQVLLSDHVEVITKGTTPTSVGLEFTDSGVPFVRVQDLVGGTVLWEDIDLFVSRQTSRSLRRSILQPGDVLVSIAGTIGRIAVVPDGAPELNCNQAVALVRVGNTLDRVFLQAWLNTDHAQEQMIGSRVTGTISNLSLTSIRNLRLPLPSPDEQARFATSIGAARDLGTQAAKSSRMIDALFASLQQRAFRGEL